MKQFLLASLLCLATVSLFARQKAASPDSATFRNYTNALDNKRQALEQQKNYLAAVSLLTEWVQHFNALPAHIKPGFKSTEASMYYNLACYNARLNNKEAALTAFEKCAQCGYSKYPGPVYDRDLESLHHEKRYFDALHTMWRHSPMAVKLLNAGSYNHQFDQSLPVFTYQSSGSPELVNFKNKYNLDAVAGNGDELSKIKNLLLWVHNTVKHEGDFDNPSVRNGDYLIELSKKEHHGYNCRMLATILKDVYQAEGFQARVVTCMPEDSTDTDCHVINVVWSKTLNKWVWMDPTFNAYVSDNKGNLLSIEEVRDKLHHSRLNELVLNSDANRNNEVPQNREEYLGYYMSKNLYWLQCAVSSEWDLETVKSGKPVLSYINLYPQGYHSTKKQNAIAINKYNKYATNNPAYFWQKPAVVD